MDVFTAGYEEPSLDGFTLSEDSSLWAGELRRAGAGSLDGDRIGAEAFNAFTRVACLDQSAKPRLHGMQINTMALS